MHELPFCYESGTVKISQSFGRYARSYKSEIVVSEDSLAQLKAIKSKIKDLFNPILGGIFWDYSRLGGGIKRSPSLKSITHILQ